jgi:4-amino-4-deoxy-L-arabinose transferase-like glycosyltransferase
VSTGSSGALSHLYRGKWTRWSFALGLICLGGLALRVAYVLHAHDATLEGDGNWYHHSANLLVQGHGFIDPIRYTYYFREVLPAAHHPPAWTLVLAVPSLFGLRTIVQHQLAACVIGAAAIGMVGLTGRRLAGPRAGLVAAGIAAVYPNLWMYERELASETLVLLLVPTAMLAAYRFWERPGPLPAMAVGVGCALLALTRAEALLLFVVLLVPLVWLSRGVAWRRRLTWFALAGTAGVVVMAPWVAYNMNRFEHPVFLTTSLGATLRVANCPSVYFGPHVGGWDFGCFRGTQFSGDASARDLQGRDGAVRYARLHAGRIPIVVLAREGRAWGVFRPFQQTVLDTVGGPPARVTRLGLFVYWPLAAAAVAGGVVLRRRRVPLFPLLAFVLTVTIAVALTFGQTRYRAPAEVPIVLLAAAAVDAALPRRRREATDFKDGRPAQACAARSSAC